VAAVRLGHSLAQPPAERSQHWREMGSTFTEGIRAPRCLVWVDLGGPPPRPPGILRFGACRQADTGRHRKWPIA